MPAIPPETSSLIDGLIDPDRLRTELNAYVTAANGDALSSDVRNKVLARLKQVSTSGREKIEKNLLKDGEGTPCSERLSELQDEIIRIIFEFALSQVFKVQDMAPSEAMSVLAVGGYGRGTLAPGSDLDLLFLLPARQTPIGESIVEYILYLLWDMGFKVGHATRNIDECIQLSWEDMTIRTSILESRLICGGGSLFGDLLERFDREVVSNSAEEFIAAKLAERDARHEKSGQSRYLVEPNVKDGKGGLRDLHTLYWIAKYYYRVRRQKDLLEKGVLSPNEFRRFRQAQDFLWAVRCHMHFLTGRAEERLSFDIQSELAKRMGFEDKLGLNAVESFMKRYFLVAKDVGDLTRIICSTLEELQAKAAPGFTRIIRSLRHRTKKIPGTEAFVSQNNRITMAHDQVFRDDPVNILRMFAIAEKRGLSFHPDAVKLITRSLDLIDDKLRENKTANALFLDILTSKKNPEAILRLMNECDVLGNFIPEFGRIVAMMQFNMYHHYTVDEHLLRSIGVLSDIEHHRLGDEHPLADEIFPGVKDRKILYVALLLHDIAKGRPEDHSIAGARIAARVCPRLGLNAAQTDLVVWLVEQHLVMSNTAQTRDLGDHQTIKNFAKTVQSMERLRYLLILTVCDTRAVGPGVWNGWKGQLLRTLYFETEPVITGGFSQVSHANRIKKVRQELDAALADWDEKERRRILDLHYPAYMLATPRSDQIRHMEFIRDSDAKGLVMATSVHSLAFEAITEITVLAPDHPRLLSIIAGACSAAGANIVGAQVHTTSDGRALDTILVNREFDLEEDEQRRAMRIGALIEDMLSGKKYLPEIIASRTKPGRGEKVFDIPPKVSIDNSLSNRYSVIEIEGLDRQGLLSDLTRSLADLNLDIASAHIVTFGEKVIDTFYVTDLVGHKIENKQRRSAIRKKLLSALVGKKKSNKRRISDQVSATEQTDA